MKNLKGFILLFVLVAIGFASCTKDAVTTGGTSTIKPNPTETTSNPLVSNRGVAGAEGLEVGCFSINYPFSLVVDGVNVEINSEDDFVQALSNPESSVDFAYPVTITNEDGTTLEIADADALGAAFATCVPTEGWDPDAVPVFLFDEECYSLVYPVSVVNQAGESGTIASEEALTNLVSGATGDTIWFFAYPISLVDSDGNTATANDANELFNYLLSCNNQPTSCGSMFGCYDLQFPVSVTDGDGNVQEIQEADAFFSLMLGDGAWNFVYPLTLIGEDGTQTVVNSNEELTTALEGCDCGGELGSFAFDALIIHSTAMVSPNETACYSINYPLNVIDIDGIEIAVGSNEEAMALIGMNTQLSYPVSLTMSSTGETITVQDEAQLMTIISDCE